MVASQTCSSSREAMVRSDGSGIGDHPAQFPIEQCDLRGEGALDAIGYVDENRYTRHWPGSSCAICQYRLRSGSPVVGGVPFVDVERSVVGLCPTADLPLAGLAWQPQHRRAVDRSGLERQHGQP